MTLKLIAESKFVALKSTSRHGWVQDDASDGIMPELEVILVKAIDVTGHSVGVADAGKIV
jgi:hypothetical protein